MDWNHCPPSSILPVLRCTACHNRETKSLASLSFDPFILSYVDTIPDWFAHIPACWRYRHRSSSRASPAANSVDQSLSQLLYGHDSPLLDQFHSGIQENHNRHKPPSPVVHHHWCSSSSCWLLPIPALWLPVRCRTYTSFLGRCRLFILARRWFDHHHGIQRCFLWRVMAGPGSKNKTVQMVHARACYSKSYTCFYNSRSKSGIGPGSRSLYLCAYHYGRHHPSPGVLDHPFQPSLGENPFLW